MVVIKGISGKVVFSCGSTEAARRPTDEVDEDGVGRTKAVVVVATATAAQQTAMNFIERGMLMTKQAAKLAGCQMDIEREDKV